MKHTLSKWLFWAVVILGFACTKDLTGGDADNPSPKPEVELTGHKVSVERALSELESVLAEIDGRTRSGGSRSVAGISTVRGSDVLPATRASEVLESGDRLPGASSDLKCYTSDKKVITYTTA